jgi:transcriptional regulator with XRE-family HTH domain
MSKTLIQGDRLKDIRKQCRMSQQQLADKSTVSLKTIKTLERQRDGVRPLRRERAEKLCMALGLCPIEKGLKILSGEASLQWKAPASPDAEVQLNYALIKRRYGVSEEWLHRHAPLLFAVVAHEYLKDREEQIEAFRAAYRNVLTTSAYFGMTALDCAIGLAEAIESSSVWDESRSPPDEVMRPMVQSAVEPTLLWYLQRKYRSDSGRGSLTGPRDFEKDDEGCSVPDGVDFLALLGFDAFTYQAGSIASIAALEDIVGGPLFPETGASPTDAWSAARALLTGIVRVEDIPEDLLGADKLEQRQAWLISKADAYEEADKSNSVKNHNLAE